MANGKGSGTGALYLADLGYPMLPAGATEQEKFNELQDYLFRLTEALRWTLEHLDESNFNSNFFLDIAVGEMYKPLPVIWTVIVGKIKHYSLEDDLGTISGEINTKLLDDVEMSYSVQRNIIITDETAIGNGEIDTALVVSDDSARRNEE